MSHSRNSQAWIRGELKALRAAHGGDARTRDQLQRTKEREPLGRVLVADDEPSIREMVKHFLEEKGYEVETAGDGAEARAKAKRYRPHVLITDINMPGLSGLDVLEDLWKEIPSMGIIVITGFPHEIPDFPALDKKAYDFVPKPLDLYYLEKSVLTRIARMIA